MKKQKKLQRLIEEIELITSNTSYDTQTLISGDFNKMTFHAESDATKKRKSARYPCKKKEEVINEKNSEK